MSPNTNSRNAPSKGNRTYASVAGAPPTRRVAGAHFRPEPLRQPWPGCTLEQYTMYVANYKVYLAALATFRDEFWAGASAASQGSSKKEMRINPRDLDNPIVYRVEVPDDPCLNGIFRSYEKAAASISTSCVDDKARAKAKIVKDIEPIRASPCVLPASNSPPPPYQRTPAEVEAGKERKRAARRRQRAARSLRDQEAALAAAELKDKVKKAELEAAKSTKRLADWTVVQHHKNKSKLPVPKLKTGANPSVAPAARPAWYPTTREQAAALVKQWGAAK